MGKGIQHTCYITQARENTLSIVKSLPEKQQEQVITSIIREKALSQGKDSCQDLKLQLATTGLPARLVLNPQKPTEVYFPQEYLDNYQLNTGAWANTMRKLTYLIRTCSGRKSVPPYYIFWKKESILKMYTNMKLLQWK